jgi:hypothetical protein
MRLFIAGRSDRCVEGRLYLPLESHRHHLPRSCEHRVHLVSGGSGSVEDAGFYSCTTGTVRCRNRLENGAIPYIEINGRRLWLRVMLADGSSCLFTSRYGRGKMAGGYECLQGAGLVEQGQWWIERSY